MFVLATAVATLVEAFTELVTEPYPPIDDPCAVAEPVDDPQPYGCCCDD